MSRKANEAKIEALEWTVIELISILRSSGALSGKAIEDLMGRIAARGAGGDMMLGLSDRWEKRIDAETNLDRSAGDAETQIREAIEEGEAEKRMFGDEDEE